MPSNSIANGSALVPQREALNLEVAKSNNNTEHHAPMRISDDDSHPPPSKRILASEEDRLMAAHMATMPSANFKITSRGDGSLMVGMEVNGVMYHGVLFAQARV